MTNPIKALTDNTGENATPVNPYRVACYEWNEWNKLNPKRPLTERQKPNISIEVHEIWQYDETSLLWKNAPPERYEKFKSFEDYKQFADRWGINTRIAYKPLAAPVDGVENIDEWEVYEDEDNRTPHEEYLDAVIDNRKGSGLYEDNCVTLKNPPQSEWNAAIDEAVRVLEPLVKHYRQYGDHIEASTVQECISKIKTLSK